MVSMGGMRFCGLGLLVAALGVGIPSATASIIDINSDLTNESNNMSPADVGIPISPSWAPYGTGYEWISYANTGCNTFDPVTGVCTPGSDNPAAATGNILWNGGATPTATFYKTFVLPNAYNSGTISIWADDTARVYIDNQLVIDANPSLGGNCASGPIGCRPGMDYTFNVSSFNLGAGSHTLQIDAFQLIGGSPFGVMYTGQIDSSPTSTPEPGSFLLLGLGLAGVGLLVPRVKRS